MSRYIALVLVLLGTTAQAENTGVPPATAALPADGGVDGGRPDWYVEPPPPDMSDWSEKRVADYYRELRDADAASPPEAQLRIPSLGIAMPVFAGTVERHLTVGAGRIEGTPPLATGGNTGLAAHRDGYFRALKDIAIDDAILVDTADGSYTYKVTELFIVEPTDVHVLDPTGADSITIVTCYPFYYVGHAPERYIVRAEKQ